MGSMSVPARAAFLGFSKWVKAGETPAAVTRSRFQSGYFIEMVDFLPSLDRNRLAEEIADVAGASSP